MSKTALQEFLEQIVLYQVKGTARPLLSDGVLEPTCMLRLNVCMNRNGNLEQMWFDKTNGKEYWKSVPVVCVNNYT